MKQVALAIALLFLSSTAMATPFKSYYAKYKIKAFGLTVGKAKRILKIKNDEDYGLEMHSWSTSIFLKMDVTESSKGNIKTNHPASYRYVKNQGDKKKTNTVTFDWPDLTAVSEYKGKQYVLPLHNDTQDKISYQLQMRKDLIAGKKEFIYTLVDDRKIEVYQFNAKGHEKIRTSIGTLDTIRMEKESDKSKRSTTFWLAPKYDYLLVKLEHVEHGTASTITIDELKFT